MDQNIKILVITVPSWNSKVGANSWATLLEKYPPENVASMYIRDEIPDSKVCSKYFNISENKIIKSIFRRNVKTGSLITLQNTSDDENQDLLIHNQRYVKMKKKRRYSMLLARELIWKVGKWHTPELDLFLDSFKPDVILHSMDGYIHLNRIIEYAMKRTGAKAVGYIWDDNFTYKQSSDIGYKIYRYFQRRSLKRLAKRTDDFFAISDMTKKEADAFFNIDCKILTKPLSRTPEVNYGEIKKPIRILYTGNLLIGRDRSLARVADAIREFPENSFLIDVYTQTELSVEKKQVIEKGGVCRVHAPIQQSEVLKKQTEADMLLFLEDIDGKDAHVARLSFSTKTTDYLSSGKAIFAVGCADTAPMQYFITNRAAIVACNDDDIKKSLSEILANPQVLEDHALRAQKVGLEKHSAEAIHDIFDNTLSSVLKKQPF